MLNRFLIVLLLAIPLFGQIKVVSSTSDLTDMAKVIGGELITIKTIAPPNNDPHYVEVLPSYMIKVRRANLYLKVGMELDLWADQIIGGSRNRKLKVIDCSQGIHALEVPEGKVDASMGDIHVEGNPHYWLDPKNLIIIAETLASSFAVEDPKNKSIYLANLENFRLHLNQLLLEWESNYASLEGQPILYYHNTWPYFNAAFGLVAAEFVESKPGVMPSPHHLDHLLEIIESKSIKVLVMEPYFSTKAPKYLAERTGIRVVTLAPSVGALPGTKTYAQMINYNLTKLQEALQP